MILMAFEVALKKPICTDSMVVEKIDILSEKSMSPDFHSSSIYNCKYLKVSNPKFEEMRLFNQLEPRLKRLEIGLGNLVDARPVRLVLALNKQDFFEVSESKVVVGTNQIKSGQLEYGIGKALLKQKMQTDADQSSLYFDALLALLVHHKVPSSTWSDKIWSDYDNLTFLQKLEFKNKLKVDILKVEKAPEFKLSGAIDLLIEIDKPDRIELSELKKQIQSKKGLSVAVKTSTGFYILPFMNSISADKIKNYKIHSKIIFADEKHLFKPVKPFFDLTERILVMAVTKETDLKSVDFRPLIDLNFEKFWARHLQFKMIQIHGPSFVFALKKHSSDLSLSNLFDVEFTRHFGVKSLGWETSDWKKDIKAFKPVALVDAIQLFRL
jgi:hypothetical protein